MGQKRAHTCGKGRAKKGAKTGASSIPSKPSSDAPHPDDDYNGPGNGPVAPAAVEKARKLIPIPQRGLGVGTVMDRLPRIGALVTPYFKQVSPVSVVLAVCLVLTPFLSCKC